MDPVFENGQINTKLINCFSIYLTSKASRKLLQKIENWWFLPNCTNIQRWTFKQNLSKVKNNWLKILSTRKVSVKYFKCKRTNFNLDLKVKIVHRYLLTTYIWIFQNVTVTSVQVSVGDTCNSSVKRNRSEWYERRRKIDEFKRVSFAIYT